VVCGSEIRAALKVLSKTLTVRPALGTENRSLMAGKTVSEPLHETAYA